MDVIRFPAAAGFLETCQGYLAAREAQHCVLLGFALAARDRPAAGVDGSAAPAMSLYALRAGDGVRAVAGVTGIAALLSADGSPHEADGAMAAMARILATDHAGLPGFEAEPSTAAAFGRHWEAASGEPARLVLRERVHRLERLVPPARQVPGRSRLMTRGDVAVVGGWIAAFAAEALPHEAPLDGAPIAAGWLDDPWREVRLWDVDGRPVSMAVAAWPTLTGVRVSYVYTPPADRGQGFATSVTAAVTASQLDAGRRTCFLYTDLANPTSNAIYRRLGYVPVVDVDRYLIDR